MDGCCTFKGTSLHLGSSSRKANSKGLSVTRSFPLVLTFAAACAGLSACEEVQEAEEELDEEIAEGFEHAGDVVERLLPDELFASEDLKRAIREEEGED